MASVFGLGVSDALSRVGSLDQVARVDRFVVDDGPARGTRTMRVVTGGGLEFDVHPDRALDIGHASWHGMPLAWISPVAAASPWAYEPAGRGWLRTFSGGLLATCGLDSFGPPADDQDGVAGMHGRIGTTPASVTGVQATTDLITITGTVRQASVFGENLVLRRRIETEVGSTSLSVSDSVTNEGSSPSPHMVLYHVNLGWPLIDDGATLSVPARSVSPRDEDAAAGFDERGVIGPPTPGFREQVFVHIAGEQREATVTNAARGVRFSLRHSETLPALFQWKMTDRQHYVLGLEPANTAEIMGRGAARAAGRLPRLQPGQSVDYRVEIEVAPA